ncbi:energy transducer TonB, partial [Vacuolonema iberomarrocanum]|uniref:energy transducer TonB n=1 Tax=Vacuolonema iberomarrocanum TaxID=3454632 RepID=UPI001A047A7A|nr:energy transducer TonB [filamentous cyanobacterium LEGE 07170]
PNPGINPDASDPLAGTDPGAGGDSGNQSRSVEGTGDNLEDVPVPGESTPTEITANLIEVQQLPPEQLQDIPDVHPEPLANSQTVVANRADARYCQVLPESVEAFGQAVTLRLIIGLDGTVQNTIVQSPSSIPAYDELARCIVQNYWTFQPATTEGIPVASDSLTATIVLQR